MPSKRLEEKLTTENLWIYILKLLEERALYAYEIRAMIEKRFGFKPGTVTAYRVLYSLERKGFVGSFKKEIGGRERRYYKLTASGRKELERGKSVLERSIRLLSSS